MERMDPPATTKGKRSEDWRERVRVMKENRGEFFKVGNYSPGVATHIRRGEYKAFLADDGTPPDTYMQQHWEVTTRKTDDGARNDIFIRWLG